jgi:hypothetical protein
MAIFLRQLLSHLKCPAFALRKRTPKSCGLSLYPSDSVQKYQIFWKNIKKLIHIPLHVNFNFYIANWKCLCGLVVRVPGYRTRDSGFDFRRYQILWEVVDLERGPIRLVRITEELLEWKSSCSGSRQPGFTAVGIRCVDHGTSSIRKRWH